MKNPFKIGDLIQDRQSKEGPFIILDSHTCPFRTTCSESVDYGGLHSTLEPRTCMGWLLRILKSDPESEKFLTEQRTVQCCKYYEVVHESK